VSFVSALAIYFVIWWVVLFAVLPFGVRNAHEAGQHIEDGLDTGAPVETLLWRKVLITTIISIAIYGLFYFLFSTGTLDMEHILSLIPVPTQ
jgi:predicted secreted protein